MPIHNPPTTYCRFLLRGLRQRQHPVVDHKTRVTVAVLQNKPHPDTKMLLKNEGFFSKIDMFPLSK